MVINWIEDLRHQNLDTPENILFVLGIIYQDLSPDLLPFICKFKDSQIMGARYTEVSDGQVRIKPEYLSADYNKFVKALVERGMTSKGHGSNEMPYSIRVSSPETRLEYARLLLEFETLDVEALAEIVATFYETGDRLPNLAKYLRESVRMALYE